MTTTDKRTPLDSTISEIHRLIDSISGRLDTIAAALDSMRVCPMHEPGDPDCRPSHGGACRPPVDMLAAPDDPLRAYRLPGGRVAYAEEAARWVQVGDWVQAVHGDEERWEEVVGTVHAETQTGLTTRSGDPRYGSITRLRWWGHYDKVRVATAPVPDPEPFR